MSETLEVTWGDDDDGGPRFPPPTQEQVAYRALCLCAFTLRAGFEYLAQLWQDAGKGLDDPEIVGMHARAAGLNIWLEREQLQQYQTDQERNLMLHPYGKWDQKTTFNGSWRKESLGVILWSLSIITSLPHYDTEFGEQIHIDHVGWLRPSQEFLSQGLLRPLSEIEHARELAELWHWRSRTHRLQERGEKPPIDSPKELNSFEKIIRKTAEYAYDKGDLPHPIKHDFPAFGKPYARLTAEEFSIATSIAMERHYALNWLCGYAEDWDNVPTDT